MAFKYNGLHVRQLRVLARITGDHFFQKKADRWACYNKKHLYRIQFFFHAVKHYFLHMDKIPIRSLLPF